MDSVLSGRYLITKLHHQVSPHAQAHKMTITAMKDSVTVQLPEDDIQFPTELSGVKSIASATGELGKNVTFKPRELPAIPSVIPKPKFPSSLKTTDLISNSKDFSEEWRENDGLVVALAFIELLDPQPNDAGVFHQSLRMCPHQSSTRGRRRPLNRVPSPQLFDPRPPCRRPPTVVIKIPEHEGNQVGELMGAALHHPRVYAGAQP